MTLATHIDVIIIGAGLSGIGTACRLRMADRGLDYAILEARATLGGTWDLFRFPGVRSDSDMETLGYPFRPWHGSRSLADGGDILAYLTDTARAFGIDRHMRFGHRVLEASWSRDRALWTLRVAAGDTELCFTCAFLVASTGYFDYERPHQPEWPGQASFGGTIVHPQFWPEELDCSDRRVIVIGSGATAVTLVPVLAERAAHVTMLQRSPSYIVQWPAKDRFGAHVRRLLPGRPAHWLVRTKNLLSSNLSYAYARRRPEAVRRIITAGVRKALGPDHDVERHFTPRYDPWDERVCVAADGDLFSALRAGTATIVTDQISHFTADGIALASGETLPADLIVTATGLSIKLLGGVAVSVDGQSIDLSTRLVYRGMMIEGVPNFAFSFGYATMSWTLKSDLTARFIARLLRRMKRRDDRIVMPRPAYPRLAREPFVTMTSGYLRRAADVLPLRGPAPWRSRSSYVGDLAGTLGQRLDDGVLMFERGPRQATDTRP